MTSCADVRENIGAYADNELDIIERQAFEEHIKNCPSCKEELEDMLRIIRICNNMPQQELPAGFKAELHEKLAAVSVRQEKIHVVSNKPKKIVFARTIASIAAGMLLIFLGGSIVRFGLLSGGFSAKSSESPQMSAETPAPATAEADENGIAYSLSEDSDTAGIQSAEPAADSAGGSASMDYGIMESEMPMEAPATSFTVNRSQAMEARYDGSYAETNSETVSSKNSTITIMAQDIEGASEMLATLASQNNGLVQAGDGADNGLEVSPDMTVISVPQNEAQSQMQLQYVFAEADYNAFVTVLNETFGAADVQTGAFVSEDMTDTMNMLIDQSVQYDTKMQKLQKDNKDSEEINKLKKEKESIDGQIEKIRLNLDFVTVTIYVNLK